MPRLNGPEYLPDHNQIDSVVIFLHGFGADGQDLIGLAPFFASHLPTTAFYAPNGPEICEISPFGRQWFSLARYDADYLRRQTATQATAFEAMYEGAQDAAKDLQTYIDHVQKKHNVSADKIALVGFSQGTMMALHLAFRQKTPFAGIVGFSGALVGASHLISDKTCTCPALLVHGEADEMLPIHAVDLAADGLTQAGIEISVIKRPSLPHAIDEEGCRAAVTFLGKHF